MLQAITKFRRERWIDQVVTTSRRMRELEVARAGIDSTLWPGIAADIDADLDRLIRRRDHLLRRLKETA